MSEFTDLAKNYYLKGSSCSEAVIKAAHDIGLFKSGNIDEVHRIASMFSGGMSSGCLCGAVAGSQIVLGCIFGKNPSEKTNLNRTIAADFIKKFKEQRKATCCKVLSLPYKDNPTARRQNCTCIVEESAQILENLINSYSQEGTNSTVSVI
jgi:C_GCAxxG_C_C family probable redox protein